MNELLDGQTAKWVNWWVNEQLPSNPFHVPAYHQVLQHSAGYASCSLVQPLSMCLSLDHISLLSSVSSVQHLECKRLQF